MIWCTRITPTFDLILFKLKNPSTPFVVCYFRTRVVFRSTQMAAIWRRIRRPFRYPSCAHHKCVWELFGPDQAGCLKCGSIHQCFTNQVDNVCPLVTLDDCSRACTITGIVVKEVRHATTEYTDTCSLPSDYKEQSNRSCLPPDLDAEIYNAIQHILLSDKAVAYRNMENTRVSQKIAQSLHRSLKAYKMQGGGGSLSYTHTSRGSFTRRPT